MSGQTVISLILNELGIKAPTFAKNIGVKYQRILDIQNGKTQKVSSNVADLIIEKYPQFNRIWILTGDGDMLKSAPIQNAVGDNNTQVAGNGNNVNNASTIDKALDKITEQLSKSQNEVAEQRKLVSKSQEQIDRLITIIEKFNQ